MDTEAQTAHNDPMAHARHLTMRDFQIGELREAGASDNAQHCVPYGLIGE